MSDTLIVAGVPAKELQQLAMRELAQAQQAVQRAKDAMLRVHPMAAEVPAVVAMNKTHSAITEIMLQVGKMKLS